MPHLEPQQVVVTPYFRLIPQPAAEEAVTGLLLAHPVVLVVAQGAMVDLVDLELLVKVMLVALRVLVAEHLAAEEVAVLALRVLLAQLTEQETGALD